MKLDNIKTRKKKYVSISNTEKSNILEDSVDRRIFSTV